MTHLSGKALRNVGHAEIGDAMATVWMVLSDRPNDRRTPIVADPERLSAPSASRSSMMRL